MSDKRSTDLTIAGVDVRLFALRCLDTRTAREGLGLHYRSVRRLLQVRTQRTGVGSSDPFWETGAVRWKRLRAMRRIDRPFRYRNIETVDDMIALCPAGSEGCEPLIRIGRTGDIGSLIETIAHEVAHQIPLREWTGSRIAWHSAEFYRHLARMLDDLIPGGGFLASYLVKPWKMYEWDAHAEGMIRKLISSRGLASILGGRERAPEALIPKPGPVHRRPAAWTPPPLDALLRVLLESDRGHQKRAAIGLGIRTPPEIRRMKRPELEREIRAHGDRQAAIVALRSEIDSCEGA